MYILQMLVTPDNFRDFNFMKSWIFREWLSCKKLHAYVIWFTHVSSLKYIWTELLKISPKHSWCLHCRSQVQKPQMGAAVPFITTACMVFHWNYLWMLLQLTAWCSIETICGCRYSLQHGVPLKLSVEAVTASIDSFNGTPCMQSL